MKRLTLLLILFPVLVFSQSNRRMILNQINHARIDPVAYGQSLGLDLTDYAPLPPLKLDPILSWKAQRLARMQYGTYLQHSTWSHRECLSYGYGPQYVVDEYIIDQGVPSLVHRKIILSNECSRVGIGIYYNSDYNLWYSALLLE